MDPNECKWTNFDVDKCLFFFFLIRQSIISCLDFFFLRFVWFLSFVFSSFPFHPSAILFTIHSFFVSLCPLPLAKKKSNGDSTPTINDMVARYRFDWPLDGRFTILSKWITALFFSSLFCIYRLAEKLQTCSQLSAFEIFRSAFLCLWLMDHLYSLFCRWCFNFFSSHLVFF